MVKMYVKRCSASLVIRKMQIKTMMRYHLTPVTIITMKNPQTEIASDGKGVEKK